MCAKKKKQNKNRQKLDPTDWVYDPVKHEVGGEQAERVVWSTKSLQMAVDALNQGLPLKSNPFCGRDTQLLKPELLYKRTKEEVEDYMKCMEDPVYFASKCFLQTAEGLKACVLRDYQVEYLRILAKNRFTCFRSCRQSGKCLNLLTKVNILIEKDIKFNDYLPVGLENGYFYINDIPLYEIYNKYCKQTFMWKLKYFLYRIISKLENGYDK